MRKRFPLCFALIFLSSVPLLAQGTQSQKVTTISGIIGAAGTTFLWDQDHHVWRISNPAVLRDKEGRRATLKFRLTSANDEIFVTSVKLIREQTVSYNPNDSAFRR
jgi:hypothetical protein